MKQAGVNENRFFKAGVARSLLVLVITIGLVLTGCASKPDSTITSTSGAEGLLIGQTGGYGELLSLISKQLKDTGSFGREYYPGIKSESAADAATGSAQGTEAQGFSQTNTQVAGVDEADIVKTDGKFLYVLANNHLAIVDVRQPDAMQIIADIEFSDYQNIGSDVVSESVREFFLDADNKQLILINQVYEYREARPDPAQDATAPDVWIEPVINNQEYTKTIIYDISDPSKPVLVRSFSQEGGYIAARKLDRSLYVISQKYEYSIYNYAENDELKPEQILPAASQTGSSEDWEILPADKIALLPEGDISNQTIIAGMDLAVPAADASLVSLIGSSGTVYVSMNYIYIGGIRYIWPKAEDLPAASGPTDSPDKDLAVSYSYAPPSETYTDIYRFKMDAGTISSAGSGTVPGTLLNQFSLDEHKGYLRLATTTGDSWMEGEQSSRNNLYILDSELKSAGKVEGLAPGETIKSVRFMGDNAWMVTFRTVDPLFGLDLADPSNPKVLGELKLPGYSAYLHPVSETRMLGFGFDVTVSGDNAYDNGLKVSLFDISSLAAPVELDSLKIGGRGSWTELTYQHKSLMSDPDNQLYGFPVWLNTESDNNQRFDNNIYFQGLLLLDTNNDRLSIRGGISQISALSDLNKQTGLAEFNYNAYGPETVSRGIRISDNVFTLSQMGIQANRLEDLGKIGYVKLPGADDAANKYYAVDNVKEQIEYDVVTDATEAAID